MLTKIKNINKVFNEKTNTVKSYSSLEMFRHKNQEVTKYLELSSFLIKMNIFNQKTFRHVWRIEDMENDLHKVVAELNGNKFALPSILLKKDMDSTQIYAYNKEEFYKGSGFSYNFYNSSIKFINNDFKSNPLFIFVLRYRDFSDSIMCVFKTHSEGGYKKTFIL